jgi:hypothetical protein
MASRSDRNGDRAFLPNRARRVTRRRCRCYSCQCCSLSLLSLASSPSSTLAFASSSPMPYRRNRIDHVGKRVSGGHQILERPVPQRHFGQIPVGATLGDHAECDADEGTPPYRASEYCVEGGGTASPIRRTRSATPGSFRTPPHHQRYGCSRREGEGIRIIEFNVDI